MIGQGENIHPFLMNNRRLAILLGIVVILCGVVGFIIASKGSSPTTPNPNQTTTSTFRETGNLVKGSPGLKPGVWYLAYEQPGQPGLYSELIFTVTSTCLTSQGLPRGCPGQGFLQGERATVEGVVNENIISVSRLSLLTTSTSTIPTPTSTNPTPTSTNPTPTSSVSDLIRVTQPQPNASITSPVIIEGRARGNWFFEASFPVRIVDANGRTLGSGAAQAQGNWMTTEFVPFRVVLDYSVPTTTRGTLILEKDNPSGLPQNARELRIPIVFGAQQVSTVVYHYNPNNDKDANGQIRCSANGLVALKRFIPRTITPLRETINELLRGVLTAEDRQLGTTTEFPLAGVTLKSAEIQNGNAILTFNDPQNQTSGGACRVTILRAQIEATAKQFAGINRVTILPAELFQP